MNNAKRTTENLVVIVDRSNESTFVYLFKTNQVIDGFNLFNHVCSILSRETKSSISEIYNFFGCLMGSRGFTFSKKIVDSNEKALGILIQALRELDYQVS